MTFSDRFRAFWGRFGPFRTVFGSFWTVSDRFFGVSDRFGPFFLRFGSFRTDERTNGRTNAPDPGLLRFEEAGTLTAHGLLNLKMKYEWSTALLQHASLS